MSKKGWDLYGNQGDSEMKNRMIEKQNKRYWVSGADSGHSLTFPHEWSSAQQILRVDNI